jgi:hypothetical protein
LGLELALRPALLSSKSGDVVRALCITLPSPPICHKPKENRPDHGRWSGNAPVSGFDEGAFETGAAVFDP